MAKKGICSKCKKSTSRNDYKICQSCRTESRKPKFSREEYARYWQLKRKYGIDAEEFYGWWVVFKGRCGICNKELHMPTLTRGQGPSAAVIDHDHITGKVRGLLCNSCNKGIGLLKDSPELLKSALEWVSYGREKIS